MGSDSNRPDQPATTLKQPFGQSGIRKRQQQAGPSASYHEQPYRQPQSRKPQLPTNYNLNIGDYVDLNVLAAHNLGKQKYPKNSRFSGWGLLDYLETKNTANLLDINNSFSFKLPQKTDLKATVGFNFFKNQYTKNRFPEELSLFYDGPDQDAGLYSFLGRFKGDKGIFPQNQPYCNLRPAKIQYVLF